MYSRWFLVYSPSSMGEELDWQYWGIMLDTVQIDRVQLLEVLGDT